MTVFGRTANASASVRRRSRIGCGSGTIDPDGSPTTIVTPFVRPEVRLRERGRLRPVRSTRSHVSRLFCAPA